MYSITRSCYDRRVSIKILSQNLFVTIFSTRNSCHHFLVSTSTLRSLSSPKSNSMLFPSRETANAIKHNLTFLFWHKINLIFSQNSNRFTGRFQSVHSCSCLVDYSVRSSLSTLSRSSPNFGQHFVFI